MSTAMRGASVSSAFATNERAAGTDPTAIVDLSVDPRTFVQISLPRDAP